jgi:hypothetical protein
MSTIQNQSTPAKTALPYGVLFGVLLTFFTISLYFFEINMYEDKTMQITVSFLTYLILPVLFIFLSIKSYKEKFNNGYLSMVDGLKIGVVVMLIAAIVSGLFNFIFMYAVPEYLEEMFVMLEKNMREQTPNLTDEQLEQALEMSKKFMSPWITIPVSMAVFSLIGLIYGLILGTIFKKEQSHF